MRSKVIGHTRRLGASIVACLALATVGGSTLASSAMANLSDCPGQYLCLWDGTTYGSGRVQFHDNGWQNLPNWGFNDVASSVYNNTNRWARLSIDINGGGGQLCIPPGVARDLVGTAWNNSVSAVNLDPSSC